MIERTPEEREARLSTDSFHTFPFAPTLATLRGEPEYAKNGRNGVTLVKTHNLRVVLMAIQAGSGLADHHAPGPITVQVVEGEVRFQCGDEITYLKPGELLSLPGGQVHAVEAVRDSAFLLTIAPGR